MSSHALKYLTVAPAAAHKATVIFIHGLGDTGAGWEPVARMFASDPALKHIKWILPHAPRQPVTCNFGMQMPSWFDIPNLPVDKRSVEDEAGMKESSRKIRDIIETEISSTGIDANHIILGGFSQGGVVSFMTGLTGERRLGGIIALSTYIPVRAKFKEMVNSASSNVPIFVGHGTQDPLISASNAEVTLRFLTEDLHLPKAESGSPAGVEFHLYEGMQHSTCMEELQDLRAWIKKVTPA